MSTPARAQLAALHAILRLIDDANAEAHTLQGHHFEIVSALLLEVQSAVSEFIIDAAQETELLPGDDSSQEESSSGELSSGSSYASP